MDKSNVVIGEVPGRSNVIKCVCLICKDTMLIELPKECLLVAELMSGFTRMHRFCDRKAALRAANGAPADCAVG